MAISLRKIWNDYGVGSIVVLLLLAYGVNLFVNYLYSKGNAGNEMMDSNMNRAYQNNNNNVRPSEPLGQNEVFSSANGVQTSQPGLPSSCSQPSIQNPSDLLPKDSNGEWAQLNPAGKGELANVNLLKSGYHIGIDTVGQSLRNANLQIRSEPPNPQLNVGPWNLSTISPDLVRVPLSIGQGEQ